MVVKSMNHLTIPSLLSQYRVLFLIIYHDVTRENKEKLLTKNNKNNNLIEITSQGRKQRGTEREGYKL